MRYFIIFFFGLYLYDYSIEWDFFGNSNIMYKGNYMGIYFGNIRELRYWIV
jgi:hypothetical protein